MQSTGIDEAQLRTKRSSLALLPSQDDLRAGQPGPALRRHAAQRGLHDGGCAGTAGGHCRRPPAGREADGGRSLEPLAVVQACIHSMHARVGDKLPGPGAAADVLTRLRAYRQCPVLPVQENAAVGRGRLCGKKILLVKPMT